MSTFRLEETGHPLIEPVSLFNKETMPLAGEEDQFRTRDECIQYFRIFRGDQGIIIARQDQGLNIYPAEAIHRVMSQTSGELSLKGIRGLILPE